MDGSIHYPDMPASVRWVFRALERIQAGESVACDEVALHYVPGFLEYMGPEQILAAFRQVAAIASSMTSLKPEFLVERGTAIGLVSTHPDGRRYRWEFEVESGLLDLQVLARGPLPHYRDYVIDGPIARVQVRDYIGIGSGPQSILLLHPFGADVGCWDMVAPRIEGAAKVRAIDLRGHGRADLRHGYSIQGCLEDIAVATSGVAADDLIIVGYSMGGYLGVEYAARTPCRALIAIDGPVTLRRDDTEEDIAAATEPFKSLLAEHANVDYGRIIADLNTPSLFVLTRGNSDHPEPQEWIERRQQLADWATQHSHTVRWVDDDHGFAANQPEFTAQIISDFLVNLELTR